MEAGMDLPTIQRSMGHARLSTTAKYLHVISKHLGCVQSPLSPITQWLKLKATDVDFGPFALEENLA
jgi:site-specific recombinase XerC